MFETMSGQTQIIISSAVHASLELQQKQNAASSKIHLASVFMDQNMKIL